MSTTPRAPKSFNVKPVHEGMVGRFKRTYTYKPRYRTRASRRWSMPKITLCNVQLEKAGFRPGDLFLVVNPEPGVLVLILKHGHQRNRAVGFAQTGGGKSVKGSWPKPDAES